MIEVTHDVRTSAEGRGQEGAGSFGITFHYRASVRDGQLHICEWTEGGIMSSIMLPLCDWELVKQLVAAAVEGKTSEALGE